MVTMKNKHVGSKWQLLKSVKVQVDLLEVRHMNNVYTNMLDMMWRMYILRGGKKYLFISGLIG